MTPPVDTMNKLLQPNKIQEEEQIIMESQDKQCTCMCTCTLNEEMCMQGFAYHYQLL